MGERMGVLGGTFDPPHAGHVAVGQAARRVLALDRVLLVPARRPRQKIARGGYQPAPAEDRYEMTRLAVADEVGLEVSRLDLDRPGPTYTVDTLEALRAPQRDLFLVLGADAAAGVPTWHRWSDVVALATLAVVPREGAELPDLPGARVVEVPMNPVDVSASGIRRRLGAGESVTGLVAPSVEAYIRAHGLYGAS